MTWLEYLGLTSDEASYVLRRSRAVDDDAMVQSAVITSVGSCAGRVAKVERIGWDGKPLTSVFVSIPPNG